MILSSSSKFLNIQSINMQIGLKYLCYVRFISSAINDILNDIVANEIYDGDFIDRFIAELPRDLG